MEDGQSYTFNCVRCGYETDDKAKVVPPVAAVFCCPMTNGARPSWAFCPTCPTGLLGV